MPVMVPNWSDLNLTPTSTELVSPASAAGGAIAFPQIEQGQDTFTEAPAPGVPRFPLSSVARTLIVVEGVPWAVQEYDQLEVPVAGCQVEPLSVDTSTPATTPPPESVAVPVSVTWDPSVTVLGGDVIAAVGAVASVVAVAATRPGVSAYGWAPM